MAVVATVDGTRVYLQSDKPHVVHAQLRRDCALLRASVVLRGHENIAHVGDYWHDGDATRKMSLDHGHPSGWRWVEIDVSEPPISVASDSAWTMSLSPITDPDRGSEWLWPEIEEN